MSFNKSAVLESLAVEAGLDISDPCLHDKVMSFFAEKNILIEFDAGEMCVSARSRCPGDSVTSEYSERVRFDDVPDDQWGSSLIVDRVNTAVRRCKYFTEPSVYINGDVSTTIPRHLILDSVEEAEDYIVVNDLMVLFKNIIDDSYIGLDVKEGNVQMLMKIKGIMKTAGQDTVLVNKYAVEYTLHAVLNDDTRNMIHVKDSVYPKFLNKVQIKEFIERN
jgi:hypothetical protein